MWLKRKHKGAYGQRHLKIHRIGLFLLGFAVIGGGVMLLKSSATTGYVAYPPHLSSCVSVTPSKTFVLPGQKFTAVVVMKNVGTSTWGPSGAFIIDEVNNGVETNNWKAQPLLMTYDVGPGGKATFNLTLTAPSTQGFYHFNWSMAILYNGILKGGCTGRQIIVVNPPVVSLNVNNQASNISITQGSGLTLSWTATNGPTACTASDSWSGAKSPPAGGTENRTADTATPGTRVYSLQCTNYVGTSTKISRSVVVNPAPVSPAPPGTKPPASNPRPPASSTSVPLVSTDTTPPAAPTNFQANYSESLVNLSWDSANADQGVKSYELERSTDQSQWQRLGDTITDTVFTDSDIKFDTTYYYRLRAIDGSTNASSNSSTQVTTGGFEPNINAGDELSLTSDDGVAKVTIPSGAIDGVASCNLLSSEYLAPNLKDYSSVTGPYELLCKLANGDRVTVFTKPVSVQITLSKSQKKQYSAIKAYTWSSDWQEVKDLSEDNSFALGESSDFAILGKTKSTPLWQKILVIILILAAVIGAGLIALKQIYFWRVRKQIKRQNQDSYNKERGY